jgi:hypothetical protein
MTCDDVKRELALRLVGLGTDEKASEVEAHARDCPTCAMRLEKARAAKKELEDEVSPQCPDFEASWEIIESQSLNKERAARLPFFRRRWVLAGGVAAVFLLGAIAGRVFLFGPHKTPAAASMPFVGTDPDAAWSAYADRLELLLVDFGNRADVERPADYLRREKELFGHILAETRALKSLLADRQDDARLSLLREAEALLTKIANLKPGDRASERNTAKIVRESPLKAKLRTLESSDSIL